MRITSVRPQVVGAGWKNWVFVEVRTTDGMTGIGEATMGFTALPVEGAVRELSHMVIGQDAADPGKLRGELDRRSWQLTDVVHRTAISAIEIAMWDLVSRRAGRPLWKALGGDSPRPTRAYANGWYRGERDPGVFADLAEKTVSRGYGGLKLDPFGAASGSLGRHELARSVAIVAAIRDRVGPATALMVDAHDRFDVRTAIEVVMALAPFRLDFLEAPCDSTDIPALATVSAASPIPIAAGERFSSLEEFERLAAETGVRIWQPESLTLGVEGMRRLAAVARDVGARLMPHNARGPVCTALNVHMSAAFGPFAAIESFVPDASPLLETLASGIPCVRGGEIAAGDGPGLGVDIDWDVASKHPYDPSHRLDFATAGWERRITGIRSSAATLE